MTTITDTSGAVIHTGEGTIAQVLRAAIDAGVNMAYADLTGANLRGVDLGGVNLSWAILCRADLRGAKLDGVRLTYADLRRADLRGTDLTDPHTDLSRADLFGTDLRAAVRLPNYLLTRARLSGARLSRADTLRRGY